MGSNVTTSIEKDQVADLEKNIIKRKAQLYDIDQTLPQKNGTYLNVRVACYDAFIRHNHRQTHIFLFILSHKGSDSINDGSSALCSNTLGVMISFLRFCSISITDLCIVRACCCCVVAAVAAAVCLVGAIRVIKYSHTQTYQWFVLSWFFLLLSRLFSAMWMYRYWIERVNISIRTTTRNSN